MSTSYIERIEISNPQRLKSYTTMFLLPLGFMPSLVWCIQNLFHTNTVVGICYRYTGQIDTFIRYFSESLSIHSIIWSRKTNKKYDITIINLSNNIADNLTECFPSIFFILCNPNYQRKLQQNLMKQMRFIFLLKQVTYTSFFNILTSPFTQNLRCYVCRIKTISTL